MHSAVTRKPHAEPRRSWWTGSLERRLVEALAQELRSTADETGKPPRLLNLGASKSTIVENRLVTLGVDRFVCDRVDIEDCTVSHDKAGQAYQCSIERMPDVPSAAYAAAFSMWVLEHVQDLPAAAAEIVRVLRPGGLFAAAVPNPSAPEFIMARHTGLLFHKWIRRSLSGSEHAWETAYAYKSIRSLIAVLERSGLELADVVYLSCTERYLHRFPLLRFLARCYDSIVDALKIRCAQGHVGLLLRKARAAGG